MSRPGCRATAVCMAITSRPLGRLRALLVSSCSAPRRGSCTERAGRGGSKRWPLHPLTAALSRP
eukprot:11150014-Lingulodinium_polyedra.AAC.1